MILAEISEILHSELDAERLWGRYIDLPQPNTKTEVSALEVMGWVLAKDSPAVAVELLHEGGKMIRRIPLNVTRPDIAKAFPDVPNAQESGFKATVSALGAKAELELRLQAVLEDQSRIPIGVIRGRRRWREEDARVGAALVSVIIPCYNQARFLGEGIESVLTQSYPHFEVVVVDDGSTDNTSEVASRYPGVRCIRQENRGLAGARNTGIRHSRGSFLVFLDADDRLLPDALATGLRHLKEHPECAFVSGYHRLIAFDGSPFPEWRPPLVEEGHYLALLRRNHIAMHATVMYCRAVFESVGGFDPSLDAAEDYDLYLRVARNYPVHHCDEVVAEYRQHGANMVRDPALMLKSTLTVLRRQRKHLRRSEQHAQAYRRGLKFWQEYYGERLIEEVQDCIEERRWRRAIRCLLVLLRYHPHGFARVLGDFYSAQGETRDGVAKQLEPKSWQQVAPRFGPRIKHNALILLYHRIAEPRTDPWSLAVTPRRFAEHLEVLKQRTRPMRLQQLSAALVGGELPPRSVVVTFDDGYADNLHNAKPLLESYNVPATVFLATGHIGCEREFWWDELDRLLLQPGTLPRTLRLSINGASYQWELGQDAHYSEDDYWRHCNWRAWEDAPSLRHSLYRSLWELLHSLAAPERRKVLDESLEWACAEPVGRPGYRCLSLQETRALVQGNLVDLGAHTVTHPALSALPLDLQRDEILRSKAQLQAIVGRPAATFAYPYGQQADYTAETISMVRESGFACACCNFAGVVERSTDRFQLPRVHVEDWGGEEFARRLSWWFDG